jgi:hypothetical protein
MSPFQVDDWIDGAATVALGTLTVAADTWVGVDAKATWQREPFPFDDRLRGRFSSSADSLSNILVAMTIAGPAFSMLGHSIDETTKHQGIIYAESLSVALFMNTATKYLAQRPRPFVYGCKDPQDRDSRLSFYSGHTALSFTAAVAGSYLLGAATDDKAARATLWGTEIALASATANLRIRAGKHYYSDVIIGALVGIATGVFVPRLHLTNKGDYSPTTAEWVAMGGGLAAGTAFAWLIPLGHECPAGSCKGNVQPRTELVPALTPSGANVSMVGEW